MAPDCQAGFNSPYVCFVQEASGCDSEITFHLGPLPYPFMYCSWQDMTWSGGQGENLQIYIHWSH